MQKDVYLNEDIDDWKILVKHLRRFLQSLKHERYY